MSTTTTATITPINSLVLEATNPRSAENARPRSPESQLRKVVVLSQLFAVTLTASVINGLVIVGLPTITKDLQLPPSLSFWPSSVNSLATASTLLLAGSLADTVGPRWVELVGSFASLPSLNRRSDSVVHYMIWHSSLTKLRKVKSYLLLQTN